MVLCMEAMRTAVQNHREVRVPYDGKVRLLLPFSPWRLLLTVHGINLSQTGLLAFLSADTKDVTSLVALLELRDPVELQLEHDAIYATFPKVTGRLTRSSKSALGYDLAFAFEESDSSVLGLVHELNLLKGHRPPEGR
ncbi:hypothetical protein E3A20_03850 [Planctomyces bekefii]|uniref:PilZ domain-containing protein n=1 Tax=Planctomyces bekefii TaxID=1653850 RepID=A0A5C6MD81_9PLAN|nr:hypothetical protein E3A20_03850 [Planctomyces bekefii]